MTGMERNSEVVQLAAYAPLLANINHQGALCPTNLIIYDNHRRGCHPHPPPHCDYLAVRLFQCKSAAQALRTYKRCSGSPRSCSPQHARARGL